MRRGKEAHHVDDFLRPACATDRDLVGQLRQHLFRDVRGHLGGDQAGRDGVDGDADSVVGALAGLCQLVGGLLGKRLGRPNSPDFDAA